MAGLSYDGEHERNVGSYDLFETLSWTSFAPTINPWRRKVSTSYCTC